MSGNDRDYISNEAAAPFTWSTLFTATEMPATLDVGAHGNELH
jgi:hypothetical protein